MAKSKTVSFTKAITPVIRRFQAMGKTKRFDKYAQDDKDESVLKVVIKNGMKEDDFKSITGTLYINPSHFDGSEDIYVIITTEAPKGFVDPTVAK